MERHYWKDAAFADLKGQTIVETNLALGVDEVIFTMSDGTKYRMYHYEDCCESVSIDDIVGDVADLLNSPILMAEESSQSGPDAEDDGTNTWTFYKLATIKGYVDIKWFGESNGYYSEEVNFEKFVGTGE